MTASDNTSDPEQEPVPDPDPLPDDSEGKIYNIQWKNTGTNYITENEEGFMHINDYDVTKYQFWKFIPTGNENCYYIKNTATGNYTGSCNLTPSSSSRVKTTTEPVEYYVAPTAATSGEIAGCYYTVLKIEGDSLLKFSRMRSLFSRQSQIYNNPCGRAGSNYLRSATIAGRNVLQVLAYSKTNRPANWHVVYARSTCRRSRCLNCSPFRGGIYCACHNRRGVQKCQNLHK